MIKKIILFVAIGLVAAFIILFVTHDRNRETGNSYNPNDINQNNQRFSNAPEKLEFFPVKQEDFLVPPKAYGLWPYGVRGNDKFGHNEGHQAGILN